MTHFQNDTFVNIILLMYYIKFGLMSNIESIQLFISIERLLGCASVINSSVK